MATRAAEVEEGDGKVLTNAISRIAEFWGLTNAKLGSILGLSQATVSRLRAGKSELDPASKSFEAGQFLLRLFRSLDALLGSDDLAARAWLATPNLDLEARPLELIDSFKGLMTAPLPPIKSTLAPPPAPRTVMERSADRHEIAIWGRIFTAGGSRDVVITDLSETGCQFTDEAEVLESGNRLTIKIGPIGPLEAAARWRRAERIGIEFATRLYPSVLDHIRQHFDLRER